MMLIDMGRTILENLLNYKSNSGSESMEIFHTVNQLSLESLMHILSAINAQVSDDSRKITAVKDPLEGLMLD